MSLFSQNAEDMLRELHKELQSKEEAIILDQLNDFISRGLLVIEKSQPTLVQDPRHNRITVQSAVRLVLKDKEYIVSLEKENAELKEKLKNISEAVKGVL